MWRETKGHQSDHPKDQIWKKFLIKPRSQESLVQEMIPTQQQLNRTDNRQEVRVMRDTIVRGRGDTREDTAETGMEEGHGAGRGVTAERGTGAGVERDTGAESAAEAGLERRGTGVVTCHEA